MNDRKILLLLLLCSVFLSGCVIYEIEDYSIVAGIGIDYDGYEFEVTYEIYKENNGETTNLTSEIKSGKGKVISEAINNINSTMSRQPYLNHCSIIILGENVIKSKLHESINYLLHDVRIRSSCYVMVSDGQRAKEIFEKSEEKKNVIAYELYKHFDNKEGIANKWTKTRFNDLINELINSNGVVILPLVTYHDECEIDNVYIVKNDNVEKSEENDVFIFQIFNNDVKEGLIKYDEYIFYIKKISRVIEYQNNKIFLTMNMEVLTYDKLKVSESERYISDLEKKIENLIKNCFIKYQELEYDPFRIYNYINKYYPKDFFRIENDYNNFFKQLGIEMKINIDLLTLGLSEERI